jgi:hypothetical protein
MENTREHFSTVPILRMILRPGKRRAMRTEARVLLTSQSGWMDGWMGGHRHGETTVTG